MRSVAQPFNVILLSLLPLVAACPPKPALPPKEVPTLGGIGNSAGTRQDVVFDAVPVGSNLARVGYDCGPPHGRNVVGSGVLATPISSCELDRSSNTLTLKHEAPGDCTPLRITMQGYKGPGTYNSSSLGMLSFGVAKVKQAACSYEGNICMDWAGKDGPHGATSCTLEVSSDGGLSNYVNSATVSGTFVCSAFASPHNGCAAEKAIAGCAITRGSFSVTGCVVLGDDPKEKKGKGRR